MDTWAAAVSGEAERVVAWQVEVEVAVEGEEEVEEGGLEGRKTQLLGAFATTSRTRALAIGALVARSLTEAWGLRICRQL